MVACKVWKGVRLVAEQALEAGGVVVLKVWRALEINGGWLYGASFQISLAITAYFDGPCVLGKSDFTFLLASGSYPLR